MIEGFDKEIDAILRQARNSEIVSSNNRQSPIANRQSLHLDADDISAFAENALPEKTKLLYTKHFADCARCRTILSNIISLNSEAEDETASIVAAREKTAVVVTVPWYRKLFLFPQLTYTMGAFVLVFGGLMAYTVVRNSSKSSEVSSVTQSKERPQNMQGASSDGETTTFESSVANTNSAVVQSNRASNTSMANSSAPLNSAPAMSNAANAPAAPRKEQAERERDQIITPEATPAPDQNPSATGRAAAPAPPLPPDVMQAKPVELSDKDKAKSVEKSEAEAKKDNKQTADDALAGGTMTRTGPVPKTAMRKVPADEAKQTGGRNFTRKNGVWYDANYKGQSTINVSRGSDDFKKLDSGLRSIANSFDGTVVVVWKSKAYRIQ